MTAWEGLSGFAVKWPMLGRLLSSRWCLSALAVIAGALGFTLLSWLFTPSSAAADQLLPPISVPAIAVPGVVTVTPGTPAPLDSHVLPSVQVSVPAVLHTVRTASETVHRLPVAAVVSTQLDDLTRLVESVTGGAEPKIASRVATAPGTSQRVISAARHHVGSARAAPVGAVSLPQSARTAPASARQQKPGPKHGPAFPAPAPLNPSCVSGGHGGTPTVAFLAAAHPTGPFIGPVRFVADQVGGDDNAARPGVTPD